MYFLEKVLEQLSSLVIFLFEINGALLHLVVPHLEDCHSAHAEFPRSYSRIDFCGSTCE